MGAKERLVDVSVVISTYNRAHVLSQTLDSICESGRDVPFDWEIVIADNNSSDDTKAVIEKASLEERRIRYVFEPRQGVSFGRNTAVEHTRGNVLLITDDDVLVNRDWLRVGHDAFADDAVAFVMGRIFPLWAAPKPRWLPEGLTGPLGLCDLGESIIPLCNGAAHLPMTANMGVRREVFRALGGLNTGLGPRGRYREKGAERGYLTGEDYEFGLRLLEAGYRGLYLPALVVRNRIDAARLTKDYYRRWMFSNGQAYSIMNRGREAHIVRWFGVPRYMFRKAVQDTLLWPGALVGGHTATAFLHELRLRAFIGFLSHRWTARL